MYTLEQRTKAVELYIKYDLRVTVTTRELGYPSSDPDAIKTYSDLEKVVDAAGATDGWMTLTVPGIVVNKDAVLDAHHTIVGTVDDYFGATAEFETGTHKVFSFTWKGTQWPDGKDAVATDDDAIQLTVKPIKNADTSNPANPTPTNPKPVTPTSPKNPNATRKSAGKPVAAKTVKRGAKGMPKTGDATLPVSVIGMIVLGGLAAFAVGARLRRRRQ